MKARAEYRPKQTDYDIADGINRSFVKTDSSKFIKFINGVGLFVGHLKYMTHFGETETLPIFPISPGVCPRPFKTWLRVICFDYCHYSAKPGKESICRGIPRRSELREYPRPCYLWGFSHYHSNVPLHVEW